MENKKKTSTTKLVAMFMLCMMVLTMFSIIQVEAKAGLKTVYVVTKAENTNSNSAIVYTYNPDGTLQSETTATGCQAYYYNDNNLVEKIVEAAPPFRDHTTTYITYNKKGQVLKKVRKDIETGDEVQVLSYKYDKKNQVRKITEKNPRKTFTGKVTYDKKGRITKIMMSNGHAGGSFIELSYNKKGRICKEVWPWGTTTIKYTVKKGRITKKVETFAYPKETGEGEEKIKSTYKYTYKKLVIPQSFVPIVQRQQANILETGWFFED